MDIKEFRKSFINEIVTEATDQAIHPEDVFVKEIKEILINDYSYLSDLNECYFEQGKNDIFKKNIKVDAGYYEISTNTLNLLLVDFDQSHEPSIINEKTYKSAADLMKAFFEEFVLNRQTNLLNLEDSQPHVQLAVHIRQNLKDLNTIQLFFASTKPIGKQVKNIKLEDIVVGNQHYKLRLEIIDIQKIFNTKAADFKKEPIEINVLDYGINGLQAVKADVLSDDYEAYLAVVPGEFLSNIYKDLGARLLEANVRSFLNTQGAVNKGIQKTILNDQSKFFAYNNGISTTAKEIECRETNNGLIITKLKDFQIINGGQTTASLASASIREKADLSNIYVQMKLTILKKENQELIRLIARYANSQNKVTNADLSSNHPYFVKVEEYSRKIYAPSLGLPYETRWFFERTRGQYKQSFLKLTQAQIDAFERINPSSQKFNKTDLAKFSNAYDLKPYDVAWGSEVNSSRFMEETELLWDDDNAIVNETYFKFLIAKAILFKTTEKIISSQKWYQEKKGYRAEMVGYVISKLILEVNKLQKEINLIEIWQTQKINDLLCEELERVSKLVFDHFYDNNRPVANIREYAKKEKCWDLLKEKTITLNNALIITLVDFGSNTNMSKPAHSQAEEENNLQAEIEVFNLGKEYWSDLLKISLTKRALNEKDISLINQTIKYCSGNSIKYTNLMARYIIKLRKRLLKEEIINE